MFRCQSLQASSCCFKWRTSVLLLHRVLSELLLKQFWWTPGKSCSAVHILDSNPPQQGEAQKPSKDTESPHYDKENFMSKKGQYATQFSHEKVKCLAHGTLPSLPASSGGCSGFESLSQPNPFKKSVQTAVHSDSLFQFQKYNPTSVKELCKQNLGSFVYSDPQKATFHKYLIWKNASYPWHIVLNKNLLKKTHREEVQRSATNSSKTFMCNNTSHHRINWSHRLYGSFNGNYPQTWTMSLSKVSAVWTQSRWLHQGAAVPVRTTPGRMALRHCLSAENEVRCRRSLEANMSLYQKEDQRRWAAVLVSLCVENGEPAFLFTLRSSTLRGRHKGDVSFAGGKRDPSDRNVIDTALREAREELGITVAVGSVWGVLKPRQDMSGMIIAPVIANLGPLEMLSFCPNPAEVKEIFTISLSHLCCPENRGYTHFRTGDRYGYTLPVFRNGKHRVWGLTAVALDHTLKLIVPP
ncbi:hypothetical protein Z043-114396 [Arapaima gigas]